MRCDPIIRTGSLLLLGAVLLNAQPAWSEGRCAGFKWDITHELALFDASPTPLSAAATLASMPAIAADHFYALTLIPQTQVTFAAPPGRLAAADGSYAGLARLTIPIPGRYRVAVDAPLWIDVASHGHLATVTDFQGQRTCAGPHKIVEFDLTDGLDYTLQFSGAGAPTIRFTVTRSPPRTGSLNRRGALRSY